MASLEQVRTYRLGELTVYELEKGVVCMRLSDISTIVGKELTAASLPNYKNVQWKEYSLAKHTYSIHGGDVYDDRYVALRYALLRIAQKHALLVGSAAEQLLGELFAARAAVGARGGGAVDAADGAAVAAEHVDAGMDEVRGARRASCLVDIS